MLGVTPERHRQIWLNEIGEVSKQTFPATVLNWQPSTAVSTMIPFDVLKACSRSDNNVMMLRHRHVGYRCQKRGYPGDNCYLFQNILVLGVCKEILPKAKSRMMR